MDQGSVSESVRHAALVGGPKLGELAKARGVDPRSTLMLDLALEEDLATRFHVPMTNDDDEQIGRMLNDDALLLGLSDAGAHTSQLCDADFADLPAPALVPRARRALTREGGLAAHRPAGRAARLRGSRPARAGRRRGRVAFDAQTVGTRPLERVYDFPAGADRLVARSTGIEHVFVAGEAIRRDGEDLTTAQPGAVVRPARR